MVAGLKSASVGRSTFFSPFSPFSPFPPLPLPPYLALPQLKGT